MTKPTRRHRKTRIIATLGPASDTREKIEALFRAGVDVFRINMSHGDHASKEAIIAAIREVERSVGRPIAIMADLQGPKLRIGDFKDGSVTLEEGQEFTLDLDSADGDETRVELPHVEIFDALQPGIDLLLDDGKVRIHIDEVGKGSAKGTVVVGGQLSNHKGVNVPNVVLPLAAITPKDRRDLEFALEQKVDWVALSFVQRPEDVAEARKIIAGRAGVLAKIEKPAALTCLQDILEISDAVMVARGDLGVELKVEEVPGMQRRIIRAARDAGKAVVVATQMLESMITSPVPTRAEVSDVANAIHEGTDAIMLSAESAVGDYPAEAVEVMNRVAEQVEQDPSYKQGKIDERLMRHATAEDAITFAARQVARTVDASAIVCFTKSGSTARRASRERPDVAVMALTPNVAIARRLCLVWGLHSVTTRDVTSFEEMVGKSKRMALRHGLAGRGDRIVVTAGVPFGTPGATNVLHIAWVSGDELKNK
ncbi:MAG: pyruvate kinase [Sphingomonadales bacterium]|nr:pyruvate kinase [Sphingomonadales bacterium]